MGLDITAYKNLKEVFTPKQDKCGDLANRNAEWTGGESMKWSETHFPGRGEGIDSDKVYTYEKRYDFIAGSYSGYGRWRNQLENFSDGITFVELINFADNEGVIGPVVSKKLFKDFRDNKSKALEYSKTFDDGDYWFERYCDWEKAFEFASQDGAVDFH